MGQRVDLDLDGREALGDGLRGDPRDRGQLLAGEADLLSGLGEGDGRLDPADLQRGPEVEGAHDAVGQRRAEDPPTSMPGTWTSTV